MTTKAVEIAATIAHRSTMSAKNRIALMRKRVAERMMEHRSAVDTYGWILDEIEQELAAAFTEGYCARDEEKPVGSLPPARRRRK